jgi:hypothetical protein
MVAIFSALAPGATGAFEKPAHEKLAEHAVQASDLDDFLKANFPEYWQGTQQLVGANGEPVIDLIADGAHNEDEPISNVLWHFHDPRSLGSSRPASRFIRLLGRQAAGAYCLVHVAVRAGDVPERVTC